MRKFYILFRKKSFQEKLDEAKTKDKEQIGVEGRYPKAHLVVLNEDLLLSHKLKYSLK
jgi:hypothetical protein